MYELLYNTVIALNVEGGELNVNIPVQYFTLLNDNFFLNPLTVDCMAYTVFILCDCTVTVQAPCSSFVLIA